MALRPGRCYSEKERPYTRISKEDPSKSYVSGVPEPKITQFEMGKEREEQEIEAVLIAEDGVQIRHNALEAARTNANKHLVDGTESTHFLKILVQPHHVLRENSIATGAGADRLQEGMRRAFGAPIGFAAQVDKGQTLVKVKVRPEHEDVAKEALRRAGHKLPTSFRIETRELE